MGFFPPHRPTPPFVLSPPFGFPRGGFPGGGRPGSPGPGGRPGLGRAFGAIGVSDIHLPLGELARSPLAATGVAIGQTAALLALLVAWVLLLTARRAPAGARPASPAQVTLDRA